MTYNELYAAWHWEINENMLGNLSPDFYSRLAAYLHRINEESPPDNKSIKVKLLEKEAKNVNRMLDELLKNRYRKIIKIITKNHQIPEFLTREEVKMCEEFASFSESYQKFADELKKGQVALKPLDKTNQSRSLSVRIVEAKTETQMSAPIKRLTLRFTKSIPAIMGTDMKSYGPFTAEDVASLPAVNAKMLVKQGLASLVEVS